MRKDLSRLPAHEAQRALHLEMDPVRLIETYEQRLQNAQKQLENCSQNDKAYWAGMIRACEDAINRAKARL